MKRSILFVILVVLIPFVVLAGEVRTTPKYLVLTEPTTNQIELQSIQFFYADNPYVVIKFDVLDSNGNVRASHTVRVRNNLDIPETVSGECVAAANPWPCCTGEGVGDCDESTTTFDAFVAGYGSTLVSRSDGSVWQYILNKYTTQDTP